jgi:hypothetical protein
MGNRWGHARDAAADLDGSPRFAMRDSIDDARQEFDGNDFS